MDTPGLNGQNDEISLKDIALKIGEYRRYLALKWMILLCAAIAGGTIGLAYSFLKKPTYTAEYSFALEDEKTGGGLSGALGLASQIGLDLGGGGGGAFSGDNLLELMKSRSMVSKALLSTVNINNKTETLAELYIDFNKLRNKWDDDVKDIHYLPGVGMDKFTLKQDSILGELHAKITAENLSVDKIDKKLSIIVVKVNTTNAIFSKYFCETLVDVVSKFYIEVKTRKASQNVNILKAQTDSVRDKLNSAINGVAQATDVNPNANPALQILRTPSQRRQVDVQISSATLPELVKNLELSRISLRKETPLIQVIDKPILPLKKIKTSKAAVTVVGFILGAIISAVVLLIKKK